MENYELKKVEFYITNATNDEHKEVVVEVKYRYNDTINEFYFGYEKALEHLKEGYVLSCAGGFNGYYIMHENKIHGWFQGDLEPIDYREVKAVKDGSWYFISTYRKEMLHG